MLANGALVELAPDPLRTGLQHFAEESRVESARRY
jgi:hypothetical protein